MSDPRPNARARTAMPPRERTGWLLAGVSVLILGAELAALPIVRHSDVLRGAIRGLNVLPIILGTSGVRMIVAARKARKRLDSLEL